MTQEELITLSASSISDLECHHKFNLHRVLRRWPAMKSQSPAQMWGIGCHKVLENVYDPTCGQGPHLDNFEKYLKWAFMSQPYPDQEGREHDIARARKILCAYFSLEEDDDAVTVGVECQQTFPIRYQRVTFSVSARLDRIFKRPHRPSTLFCRDYKTGGHMLTLEQCWVNLITLKKMQPGYAEYCLEVDSLSNAVYEENRVERVIYNSRDFGGVIEEVTQKVRRFLEDDVRLPRAGSLCQFCPERPTCLTQEPIDGEILRF